MTCNACGEKPKDTAKDFTKAVIEINNPETLVLLRKVVIPASMGTEEQVPPAIGKYHNVILYYEANKHTYLYSSDGIPTSLESNVPQEVLDKIDQLEDGLEQETTMRKGMDEELQSNIDAVAQDLEDFKNSPDVVDIVPTYAALQAYDTSKLGNNDEIRVLADETHDGASAYYRWDKTNNQWIFIGITGPYYTKDEVDGLLSEKQGELTAGNKISINNNTVSLIGDSITVLTPDDYDYPVDNPDGIALWSLPVGIYKFSENSMKCYKNTFATISRGVNHLIIKYLSTEALLSGSTGGRGQFPKLLVMDENGVSSSEYHILNSNSMVNNLISVASDAPLAAYQGRILNERIGDLSTLQTTAKTSTVAAINELVSSGGGVATINSTDWSALWQ